MSRVMVGFRYVKYSFQVVSVDGLASLILVAFLQHLSGRNNH